MTADRGIPAAHCEQSSCNSCLAACIAAIRVRTGHLAREDATAHEQMLMETLGASPKGLNPEAAAHELRSQLVRADPDVPDNLVIVRGDLLSGRWWHIAMLYPGPLNERHRRQRPQPLSRHGTLSGPLPHHAVVLTAFVDDAFLYLDPWFSSAFQPQSIPFVEFARVWTGRYIPVKLP